MRFPQPSHPCSKKQLGWRVEAVWSRHEPPRIPESPRLRSAHCRMTSNVLLSWEGATEQYHEGRKESRIKHPPRSDLIPPSSSLLKHYLRIPYKCPSPLFPPRISRCHQFLHQITQSLTHNLHFSSYYPLTDAQTGTLIPLLNSL